MADRTFLGVAALCVTAVVTLTACGEGEKADTKAAGAFSASASPATPFEGLSPAEIAEKSRLVMAKLRSLRVTGSATVEGKEMTVDVAVAGKGNCLGTFGMGGGTGQVRWYGGYTYTKGDKKFWQESAAGAGVSSQQADAVVGLLAGRWLRKPAGSTDADDEFPFCDTTAMFTKDQSDSALKRGADTDVNGTRGVTLTGKDGAATRTLVVATDGQPYDLRMSVEGGKEPQTVEFSGFNKPVTLAPPPTKNVIDMNKLHR
ncbi:hypothetical protein ACFWIJ_02590 [Streptomyces sp. NPDC127079]|uniref:hypothetical protein n=1 Tax=Streptomyces sp. NPDC127079 TaxID=3347132 RepID=UPI00365AC378